MPVSNQLKNQHLLWRTGFGPSVQQLNDIKINTPVQLYKTIAKAAANKPAYISVADETLLNLYQDYMDAGKRKNLAEADRRDLARRQREAVKKLNLSWLKEIVTSPAQLREKMAFFWHGHFASRNNNIFYNQLLLHTIRENALGNFSTLLKEVSRSASMLYFLNNQQNRKGRPNENFAREVMELFTLGRGNYSENDIKEAARAFTGWTANAQGEFIFRKNQHDDGVKKVLGQKGNFDGDDILKIILNNKQTAKFITQKIYRFFVNENIDLNTTNQLAEKFYKSNYDISELMAGIFTSDWFYAEKNIGSRIKSPIELLAGIQRLVPMQLDNENALLNLQRLLGQQLLYPPNVAGWPGGRSWIDSSTLMTRMRIPQMFNDKDELNITPKPDDDQMMGQRNDGSAAVPQKTPNKKAAAKNAFAIKAVIDWPQYISKFEAVKREELIPQIKNYLMQTSATDIDKSLDKSIDTGSREAYIKSVTVQLMSTPEYQLC